MQLTIYAIALLLAVFADIASGLEAEYVYKDWYDHSIDLGVDGDGMIYSLDDDVDRRITSPQPLEGDVDDYLDKVNV